MAIRLEIPGGEPLSLEHLLLDQNGTLSNRGELIEGVQERLLALTERLVAHILTADTFGTLDQLTSRLGIEGHRVHTASDKLRFLERLGAQRCVAIGNGRNDVEMLGSAALGIAVLGPEGASTAALRAAEIACGSVLDALDLLLDERALVATLRG